MAENRFIHLRTHSAYSLAEGAIIAKDMLKLAKSNNMPAIAITDTHNMFEPKNMWHSCINDKDVKNFLKQMYMLMELADTLRMERKVRSI